MSLPAVSQGGGRESCAWRGCEPGDGRVVTALPSPGLANRRAPGAVSPYRQRKGVRLGQLASR
jgi:hypothetical protein